MPDIDRLPSGKWQARWRDTAGRQRKESFKTKAAAEQKVAEVMVEKARGLYVDERLGRVPLKDYAWQWLENRPYRPGTRRRVESMIRRHLEPLPLGQMPIRSIRVSDVQGWATGRAAVLSPGSTRLLVKVVRSMFLAAVEDRLIPETPARRISLPSREQGRVVPLTAEQVSALAGAVPARCSAMVIAQAGLGLRIGELLGLRVQDVDWLRRTVRIEEQIRQHDRQRVAPKTARSMRTIPLPQVVGDALAAHLGRWNPGEDGSLFVTGSGLPYRQDYYGSRVFKAAVRRASLPDATTSHTLRHTYVSMMLDAGVGVAEVAELIGDTVVTVMQTYAHLMPGREDRARSVIDSALCAPVVPAPVRTVR